MKKTFYLIALLAMFLGFSSCEKEEETVSSKVEITVKDGSGNLVANETVYMFKEPATETFGNNPIYANKNCITNDSGVATFELQDVFDLDPISTQTSLYFTIFSKISGTSYIVKSTVGVTIKKGETLKKTMTISK
jgi:hypothetical protein